MAIVSFVAKGRDGWLAQTRAKIIRVARKDRLPEYQIQRLWAASVVRHPPTEVIIYQKL